MNYLTQIKDGDASLRLSGTFGLDKTVTINSFGGTLYLHLKRPNQMCGFKTFSMTKQEYSNLVTLIDVDKIGRAHV